ncbi:MAG: hypothetical protein DBW91_02330 [Candidatus Thioglobus sp.]|nr:MAG: hypothetical protein DBW91_02330 [Candidatus Thioglobus sp.]
MPVLAMEIVPLLFFALFLGAFIGWFINNHRSTLTQTDLTRQIEQFELRIAAQNSALLAQQRELDIFLTDNQSVLQELAEAELDIRTLRGDLALARGQAALNASRWQNSLKQARQLPAHKLWIKSLQKQCASKQISYQQNRQYAERLMAKQKYSQNYIQRLHTSLTKNHIRYQQLRHYADAIRARNNSYQRHATRAHTRLTAIEHLQQPLRRWIRVFQNKLMKTKTDYAHLRSYADHMQQRLTTYKHNLAICQSRLTVVSEENTILQQQKPEPLIPPLSDVNDSTTLRALDRIRLLGVSKDSFLGRVHNQILEAKLETIATERTLTARCETKDGIIQELREKISNLDNELQHLPTLEAEHQANLTALRLELETMHNDTLPPLQHLLREHEYTIEAYRSKVARLQLS